MLLTPADRYALERADHPALLQSAKEKIGRDVYDFNPDEVSVLKALWKQDPSTAPYPEHARTAYASQDAIAMNALELCEVGYALPYYLAYEEVHVERYRQNAHVIQQFVIRMGALGDRFQPEPAVQRLRIVDWGCGIGSQLMAIAELWPDAELHGCEFAQTGIDWIRRHRPRIVTQKVDLRQPTDVGATFHIAACLDVLEHLEKPGFAVEQIYKHLAMGGVMFVSVPDGRRDTAMQHINFWSPESWSVFIRACVPNEPTIIGQIERDPTSCDLPSNYALIVKTH
jgi:2-polyprenyl-3-methyl-5-hydroxy-6-metoxy-1,4-benzoquinol methylase